MKVLGVRIHWLWYTVYGLWSRLYEFSVKGWRSGVTGYGCRGYW